MRTSHKASEVRQSAALELVLEHPRGQQILDASGGDAEHALRIVDAINRRDSRPIAEVIHLPREPILDVRDVLDPEGIEPELPAMFATRGDFAIAIGYGLVAWAIIAAIAYAAFRLVEAFT